MTTHATNHSVLLIKRTVCSVCSVTMRQMNSRNRIARIAFARHLAMALCNEFLTSPHPYQNGKRIPLTYSAIAHQFDRGCHGTVENAVLRVAQAEATCEGAPCNPEEQTLVEAARAKVQAAIALSSPNTTMSQPGGQA